MKLSATSPLYIYDVPFFMPSSRPRAVTSIHVNKQSAEHHPTDAFVLQDVRLCKDQRIKNVVIPHLRASLPKEHRLILIWQIDASKVRVHLETGYDLLWPIVNNGLGSWEIDGGTCWVVTRIAEGADTEIVYVVEDRAGHPLIARVLTIQCFRVAENVFDLNDLYFKDVAEFDRHEIGWTLPQRCAHLDSDTRNAHLAEAKALFFEKINPRLKCALVSGPTDKLLVRRPLCFEFGNAETMIRLAEAAIAVANIDISNHDPSETSVVLFSEQFYGNGTKRDCFASAVRHPLTFEPYYLEDFLTEHIVRVCFPTGYTLESSFDGPSRHFKSSYKPIGYHWRLEMRTPTAHEQLAAQRLLRAWLTGPAGLSAKEADAALGSLISR